jgi:hypothetical protein
MGGTAINPQVSPRPKRRSVHRREGITASGHVMRTPPAKAIQGPAPPPSRAAPGAPAKVSRAEPTVPPLAHYPLRFRWARRAFYDCVPRSHLRRGRPLLAAEVPVGACHFRFLGRTGRFRPRLIPTLMTDPDIRLSIELQARKNHNFAASVTRGLEPLGRIAPELRCRQCPMGRRLGDSDDRAHMP